MSHKMLSFDQVKAIAGKYSDVIVKESSTGRMLFTVYGGRLLGVWPKSDGHNPLWIYPDLESTMKTGEWMIGGERLWIAPERHFFYENPRDFEGFHVPAEIDPGEYIVVLPKLNSGKYHAVNCLADIYLDSIGWSGGNTTMEALACNLPVVTLPGEFMRGRHSAAILQMMKVEDTIASNIDDYIEIAAKLGQSAEWRRQVSDRMRRNKHLVYEDKICISALEDFLERAVKERPDRGI